MAERLRVVHLINSYLPRVGGAERQLAALAPCLQAAGVEVTILARRYPGMVPFERLGGVPVHRLPVPGPKALAAWSYTLSALALLRRLRPTLLHAHELFSTTTTAIAAKRLWGVPVVVTPHRGGPPGDVQRLHRKPFGARRMAAFREQVDGWISISTEIDAELAAHKVPPTRRFSIPNGVDSHRFAPLAPEARAAQRRALGLPDGPLLLFVGRLAREKRVHALLDVWPALRAAHPDSLLLIVGSGPEEATLRGVAGEGVRFEGQVDDVLPYLQVADLFVLPSAAEGLSVALLEAMSTGVAVVATQVGGASDVIEQGVSGCLLPPDDLPALQAALLFLLENPARRATMGSRGQQTILQRYSLSTVVERLQTLYEQLARSVP